MGGAELLYSVGTIQYLNDPLKAMEDFTSLGADVILFAGLPLTEREMYTIVQKSRLGSNGPGPLPAGIRNHVVTYPVSFLNRSLFEETVSRRYVVAAMYRDTGGDCRTPLEYIKGRSYLLLRRC